jgi:hypothetical protein
MSESDNNVNTDSQLFNGGEFVMTSTMGGDGKPQFIGGGYKINFMNNGISPLTTLSSNNSKNIGGGLSGLFENLAVPSGLYYSYKKTPSELIDHNYNSHNMLADDIFDKLLGLVEYDKKRKRKTRKQDGGQPKIKRNTRKHHN